MATDGAQTSEFKLTAGGILAGVVAAVLAAVNGQPVLSLILVGVAALLVAVYTIGRSLLKRERSGATDWLSPSAETILDKSLATVRILSDALKLVLDKEAADGEDRPESPAPDDPGDA